MSTSTHNLPSVEDLLGSSPSVPPVKFPNQGDSFTGTVVSQESQQQRDFRSQQPIFWPDGSPKMQVVVTCTDQAGDQYRLFLKGQMLTAARAALSAKGLTSFELGGTITVTFVREERQGNAPYPTKIYEVEFSQPDPAAAEAAQVAAVMSERKVTPEPASPEPKTAADLTPEALAALRANGLI